MQSGCLEPGSGLQLLPFETRGWGEEKNPKNQTIPNFTNFSNMIFHYFLDLLLLFQDNDTALLQVNMQCKNTYQKYRSCVILQLTIETTKRVGGRNRNKMQASPVPQEKPPLNHYQLPKTDL